MDLISKTALLNDLCEDREEGTFCFTDSQTEAADKIIVYVTKRIDAQPSVPAVPLDKLCEWLGETAIVRCQGCSQNCCDGEICCSSDHWRKEITKWMEEQDADDRRE